VKSASNVSPARYVVEQRIAYRPAEAQQVARGNTFQSSYSRENYGPGEKRYSPLRKDGKTQEDSKKEEEKKVQFEKKDDKNAAQTKK
jgi:hypothetical protein